MLPNKRHFYHPYSGEYFGFYSVNGNDEERHLNGFVLEDIDLYYQPLPDPIVASLFWVIRLILAMIGWVIYVKVWKMLDIENGLVKEVTKIYTIALMIGGTTLSIFVASTDFLHPVNEVIGQWYCDLGWFVLYTSWFTMNFHSFIVASMRYLFVIQEEKLENYGKEKVRKVFHILSIFLPFLLMIWSITDKSDVDAISFFNKCNGNHHKVFLFDTSTQNVAKRNFCEHVEYDDEGSLGKIIAAFRRCACIIRTLLILFMGFNFAEIYIYFKILSHMYR